MPSARILLIASLLLSSGFVAAQTDYVHAKETIGNVRQVYDGNLMPGDGCDDVCQSECPAGSITFNVTGVIETFLRFNPKIRIIMSVMHRIRMHRNIIYRFNDLFQFRNMIFF